MQTNTTSVYNKSNVNCVNLFVINIITDKDILFLYKTINELLNIYKNTWNIYFT